MLAENTPKLKKTGFIHYYNKKKDIVGNVFFTIQVCFCNGASMSGLVYIAYIPIFSCRLVYHINEPSACFSVAF